MEREVIQSVGFRNIKEDGKVTGFQFKVRLPYYRGIFLSQLRPGTLFVDGERNTHWSVLTPAVLKVKKEGGLAQGYHDLKYGFCFTSSYMPPITQDTLNPDEESFIFMPEFGHHVNERHLLIV